MRFASLRRAGGDLALALGAYAGRSEVLVLGIVRGGVPVAVEVAKALKLPLDVLLRRSLLLGAEPGAPLSAAWVAGTLVLDEGAAPSAAGDPLVAEFLTSALAEFAARNALCRGDAAPRPLEGKTILLVDNGMRTGGTVRTSIRALRSLGVGRIVVAVPVADAASLARVSALADEVVCLASPQPFGHVGMWYADFGVPALDQVRELVAEAAG